MGAANFIRSHHSGMPDDEKTKGGITGIGTEASIHSLVGTSNTIHHMKCNVPLLLCSLMIVLGAPQIGGSGGSLGVPPPPLVPLELLSTMCSCW